jgi:hypothetical protein
MAAQRDSVAIYLEQGQKRTFAGAIEWPGWCRGGRDAESAIGELVAYGPRYAQVLQTRSIAFQAPEEPSALSVAEQLTGTTTTDFGAPDVAPAADSRPLDAAELDRLRLILEACWAAFDAAVVAAEGRELRRGPRGGGRDREGIVEHVMGAEQGYLGRLAWKRPQAGGDLSAQLSATHEAALAALAAAGRGELPERGPRGGTIWAPRYYVRRVAWHVLDHLWELEDRQV